MQRSEFGNQATVRCQLPSWLSPTLLDDSNQPFENFSQSHTLTQAGDIILLPTPGHTEGHQSILLLDGELSYLFAGDMTFSDTQLLDEKVAGIATSREASLASIQAVKTYAAQHPTIYLPSHDAASGQRLANGQTILVGMERRFSGCSGFA